MTFLTFCSNIFSLFLVSSRRHEIWCHSLIKFDRLRPFPIIHRLLAIVSSVFWDVRVCSSLSQFDRVRIPSFLPGEPRMLILGFLLNFPPATLDQPRSHRQDKQRTASDRSATQVDAGVTRLNFIPRCQRVIDVVRFWFWKSK